MKKDALKVAGIGWLAAAATHAYNVQVGGRRGVPAGRRAKKTRLPGSSSRRSSSSRACSEAGLRPAGVPAAMRAPPPSCLEPQPQPRSARTQNNLAQRDTGTAIAVGEALLGALCVYRRARAPWEMRRERAGGGCQQRAAGRPAQWLLRSAAREAPPAWPRARQWLR